VVLNGVGRQGTVWTVKTVKDGQGRSRTVKDGEGRSRTVRDGSVTMMKRWVTMSHDDKKTVTGRSRDDNGTVTVTGQNHNFYSTLNYSNNVHDKF
jgi:hypothetical protein